MHKFSERNVYTDILFLARFKKHNSCKISARNEKVLQEFCKIYFQVHQSCKICVSLQEFCISCLDSKKFATFLQKLFFLWTRDHCLLERCCSFFRLMLKNTFQKAKNIQVRAKIFSKGSFLTIYTRWLDYLMTSNIASFGPSISSFPLNTTDEIYGFDN